MKGVEKNVIVLAGMIGAGKSSYTELIAKELGTKAFYESIQDNRILELFYADPKRWAFALQIYFLNTRFRSIKAALTDQNNVLDRSIYEDALFTQINYEEGNISEPEMDTYLDLLDNMMEELEFMPKKAPDLLIYLRGSLDTVLKRISLRGRPYEQIQNNPGLLDYYKHLHSRYDSWFESYNKSATLVINIDEVDINKPAEAKLVMQLIHDKLKR
ncbi:deoxynucleoside kinase [Listeria sp. FSL L7-1485]|uniref:Deoxynucleoside kinase n=1 Tax=Listeria immobilis TaxID=2713502 RepID=A0A7X0X992_9LIST|nr:deoxynucleoside kinase [Listeria immobilis]MBC1483347.1 deoxynucleoside kinase [Listeria immobilis]MBC1489506.1 deoxynucleoside kinase [Listeria immobilis]MBC1507672.1 deoxynucleoside kinase [Listeria immobilis]MBC1510537.1 deoxynucleoside kinase [Listeria immobilis]MBC1516679.1 deoxynucleoside kinase [Listeria immobilis]